MRHIANDGQSTTTTINDNMDNNSSQKDEIL